LFAPRSIVLKDDPQVLGLNDVLFAQSCYLKISDICMPYSVTLAEEYDYVALTWVNRETHGVEEATCFIH
jgi:hypothetical protein